MKLFVRIVSMVMLSFLLANHITHANADIPSREAVFQLLKAAHKCEGDLSETPRTMDEIIAILDEYHTRDYQNAFIAENVKPIDGKFITFGTDFAFYYIPFFSYSDATKIVYKQNQIYVYEFFPERLDGPVSYKDHYEGVMLEKTEKGYLVAKNFLNNVPEEIINYDVQMKHQLKQQFELAYMSMIKPIDALVLYSLNYLVDNG